MSGKNTIKWWFAIGFLIAIPALVHTLFEGAYVVNPGADHWTFWIGPISTTVPYLVLTLLFLAHCARLKSWSWRSAYYGAVMGWLGMMAFTIFLILQVPGPQQSSTMSIAVALTPFFYIPFLVLPYIVGAIAGRVRTQWKEKTFSHH